MKPAIVVTQQMGSHGGSIAGETATLLDYRFVTGTGFKKAAQRHGLHGSEWRWLEQGWYRLFARMEEEHPTVRLEILRPTLVEDCARPRGTLFLGRGVEELLRGHVPLIHGHVVAPFEVRAARIAQQVNLLRSGAEERVRHSDEENRWYYRTFFGINWDDLLRPDIVIDTGRVSIAEGTQMLAEVLKAFVPRDNVPCPR